MSALRSRIDEAVKQAMKSGDRPRLGALRLITAAIKQVEVDTRKAPTDEDVLAVLSRMVKQRRESIEQYEKAGRDDLAAAERAELAVIGEFLPEPLSEAELESLVQAAIAETGAAGPRDMGRVMAALKPRVQGRADMGALSARVKARLNS